jgi:ATP-binding cassette subfamily A (ABC1) protein 3
LFQIAEPTIDINEMSSVRPPPQWRRIYRQTITLTYKNLLIAFKAPIATVCRALIFPIVVTLIFCFLRHIGVTQGYKPDVASWGIATSSTPIKDLGTAINALPHDIGKRLVFVRNGISNTTLGPIIEGILNEPTMKGVEGLSVDDPSDLFTLCRQTLAGSSNCYAAVLFSSFNETNVEYTIAMDESALAYTGYDEGMGDHSPNSRTNRLIFPLQYAVDSHIGNFSTITPPSTQGFSGVFGPHSRVDEWYPSADVATHGPYWLNLVAMFVAPLFFLVLIGVVYHLNTFVATERQTTISELMAAQNVTTTPRILSTLITFYLLYFPGLLICSVLFTQILFTHTSDILFLFVMLLAGASVITSSHFVGSFFGKAQLAGLYSSTLTIALAFVTLDAALKNTNPPEAEIVALSLLFPPACFANFITDVAYREYMLHPFSLKYQPPLLNGGIEEYIQKIDGYKYVIFFIVQIVAYTAATYAVERGLWGVPRKFENIPAGSDVALRCTGLTKTYYGKRPWYWPFVRKGEHVIAIDNLNLEVKKGSVTFLLGPNGGGKTTTLKCVAGMISMDPGSTLALNEAGTIFGICPQTNVSLLVSCERLLVNLSRYFGTT